VLLPLPTPKILPKPKLMSEKNSPNWFLAKTDPDTYSLNNLITEKETLWDGVHNNTANLVIKSWKIGDKVFFYHSQTDKAITAIMEVIGEPYLNPNDPRPSWVAKVKLVKALPKDKWICLKDIKASGLFSDFMLIRQPRLSVMSCPKNFVDWVLEKSRIIF
jgi:predicted RNA-binding protein with PUA-like domain